MALLRHLALRCSDLERSRHFYEHVIGWRFVGWRPSGNSLDLSDGVNNITLLQHDRAAAAARPKFAEGDEYIHFGVIVPDLAACLERCQAGGFTIVRDDVKERRQFDLEKPPERSFKVFDPDGNVVDVACRSDEWRGVTV